MSVAETVHDHPPVANHAAGRGHLTVEIVADQSAAISTEARSPLKILIPRPRGQSVWAYISNFGGGLLPGDELELNLNVGANARCFVGTQSSTKIFRHGPKGAVKSSLTASIGPGAFFVWAPDVSQCFANSRYRQRQSIRLSNESSNLVFVDWYSSGRTARGERWDFAEYSSRTEIHVDRRLLFLDSIHLESELSDRMGRANCLATVVILGTAMQSDAQRLLDEISHASIAKRADVLIVASPLGNGLVLRAAGVSVEAVGHAIFSRLAFVSPLLGDNPFERKW